MHGTSELALEMTSCDAPPGTGDDDWRGLLTDASGGGGHYFDTGGPRPEPLGLALLHPSTAGVLGPSFTRLLARSK